MQKSLIRNGAVELQMARFIENCSGRIFDHVDMLHTDGWIVGVASFYGGIVVTLDRALQRLFPNLTQLVPA